MRIFIYPFIAIMFTLFSSILLAQDTITVQPDDKVVTNTTPVRIKNGPIENDLIKVIDLNENMLFSIKLDATNFDRYIRITSHSTNLDFVRFTRDKTNAFITFKTLTSGIGKLDFQVDNEESIIRRYFYTINVTNNIASTETNTILEPENDTTSTNQTTKEIISTNQTDVNTDYTNNIQTSSILKDNTPKTQKASVENNTEIVSLFNSAENLKNIKDYDNAINAYNNIIKEYPNSKYSIYSHFRIGDIYNQRKDYDNAFNTYEKISTLNNANENEKAAAIYSMGVSKKLGNNYDESIIYFNDIINNYSKTAFYGNALYDTADILKQLDRNSEALSLLEKSINESSKFDKRGDSILLLAEIYEKGDNNIRNFDKAYRAYNQYLYEYPNSPKAKYANDRKNFLYRNAVNLR